jgi:putative flavoprotein involved in K+ transport
VVGDALPKADAYSAVVIGAGPAGLAAGAMLRRHGVDPLLLERTASVGDLWRGHYDRLHLHTIRSLSNLPGLPIPWSDGRWVSRDGVARYLDAYARHHRLEILHDTEARRVERSNGHWAVHTFGPTLHTEHLVVATGFNRTPRMPQWPGRDSFEGELIHSSEYRNPEPFRGKHVLVVGTGNSGAEIAVDLVEGSAREVTLAVRTPPNILPRLVLGIPTQVLGLILRRFPPAVADTMGRNTQRFAVGDLSAYGLRRPPRGVNTRHREDGIVPILDVGLVPLIKARRVRVVGAVERFEGREVIVAGGTRLSPDAVIAATGFGRGLEELVGHLGVLAPNGRPRIHGSATHPGAPNLYFIGFTNPISGNLRELGIDARRIARAVRVRARTPVAAPGTR